MKTSHEVRDAVHGFIRFNNVEKQVIDSAPFQRLRYIHQLALTYQVYPGATHRRFEHSLGVMEVASRIYDRLFNGRLSDDVNNAIADKIEGETNKTYWRSVVRMAALLHDVGHLPFSHAAEAELLPQGWTHERLTADIIRHSEISVVLYSARPSIDHEDVIDVAYALQDRLKSDPDFVLSPWKTLLNEIITGNTFGADRIDYLLRDSHHAGVAYGRFDPDRLIDGLLVVVNDEANPAVALDVGAIHAAEALLLARYFMYTQVYFHDVRRAYDQHLLDYLSAWLPKGKFSTNWQDLILITDNDVLAALLQDSLRDGDKIKELADRVVSRQHFRTIYSLISSHKRMRPLIFDELLGFATKQFGEERIRSSRYGPKSERNDFLVVNEDGTSNSSLESSGVISTIPDIEIGFIFADQSISQFAKATTDKELSRLLKEGKDGF
jgi:HD superfamily phosphohydrolase